MSAPAKAKDITEVLKGVNESAQTAPANNLPAIKNFLAAAAQVPANSPVWSTVSNYLERPSILGVLANGGDGALGEELSDKHLLAPAALLAGVVTLHNPLLLAQAVNLLKSGAAGSSATPDEEQASTPAPAQPVSGNATLGAQLQSKGIALPQEAPNTPALPFRPGVGISR